MAGRSLTRVQGGVTTTLNINTDRLAGVTTLTRSDGSTTSVDRTAPVIDSDRKGQSRPLLSKLVGGAAGAYSLRDLNDKQGYNKVIKARKDVGGSAVHRVFRARDLRYIEDWSKNYIDNDFKPDLETKEIIDSSNLTVTNLTTRWTGLHTVAIDASGGVRPDGDERISLIHSDSSKFTVGTYELTFNVQY